MGSKIPAVFAVNRYLWSRILADGILDPDNYDGLIPLVPIQESAPFIQAMEEQSGIGQFPFIVYSWYANGIGSSDWYKQTDTFIYTIYSTDQAKLNQLVLLLTNHLKRYDDSAAAVNRFKATLENPEYALYDYKSISIAAINGGSPTGLENAPNAATITVRAQYTHDGNDEPLP
jgi:hypothetical protein